MLPMSFPCLPAGWRVLLPLLLLTLHASSTLAQEVDEIVVEEEVRKTEASGSQTIPPRSPGFSFVNSSSGKVTDFAQGESPSEILARHKESMLRKYDRDGDGALNESEKARQMNDHFVQHKRLIKQYDKNGNKKLDKREAQNMTYTIYLQRLNFMKLYDENQDGYLDNTETRRMRTELKRRQEIFLKNMDR